jgi:hypothetical protein
MNLVKFDYICFEQFPGNGTWQLNHQNLGGCPSKFGTSRFMNLLTETFSNTIYLHTHMVITDWTVVEIDSIHLYL